MGRTRRKASGRNLCWWKGTKRKREIARTNTCPEEWAGQATDWVSQSWGPTHKTKAPLAAWRTAETDRKTPLVRSTQVLACPQAGQRKVCSSACYLTVLPSPSRANTPAPSTPHHSLAPNLEQTGPGKRLDLGKQRWPRGLRCGPGGTAQPLLMLTQIAPQKQPRPLMVVWLPEFLLLSRHTPKSKPSKRLALSTPHHSLALDLGQPWQEKRYNHELHLSRATDAYTGSISDLCKCTSPTCFSTPLLWGEGCSVGKRKNTHLKGIQPAWAQPSGLPL